jgi:hypothetical protein
MKTLKTIGLALTMFIGILTAHSQTTQTDTTKEAKTNLIKYLNLSGSMLSESTGYIIKYDDKGDGNPVDLKYTSEKRLSNLAKASEYYKQVASYFNIVSTSLTPQQKDDFKLIDESMLKIINDADYKKLIAKPVAALPLNEIFPTITFIEIVKAKIEKLEKEILK